MPWITRRERDREHAERDRLLTLVENLTDKLGRLERVREGLPEAPVERKPQPVMPEKVRALIDAWKSAHTRAAQERRAFARFVDHGGNWEKVYEEMAAPLEDEEAAA